MKQTWIFILGIFLLAAQSRGQGHESEFDFWVGEWSINQKILQADGTWKEFPAITRVEDEGFALVEHWSGQVQFFWEGMKEPRALQGLSVRSYNSEKRVWQIWWMDSRNPEFGLFEGTFSNGKGSFYRSGTGADGRPLVRRILFSNISARSVQWELAISSDGRESWTPLWIMNMTKSN